MIPAQLLYRLLAAICEGEARFDEVSQADEADRDWLVIEQLMARYSLDVENIATLARVLAGEGHEPGGIPRPGQVLVTTWHDESTWIERDR